MSSCTRALSACFREIRSRIIARASLGNLFLLFEEKRKSRSTHANLCLRSSTSSPILDALGQLLLALVSNNATFVQAAFDSLFRLAPQGDALSLDRPCHRALAQLIDLCPSQSQRHGTRTRNQSRARRRRRLPSVLMVFATPAHFLQK